MEEYDKNKGFVCEEALASDRKQKAEPAPDMGMGSLFMSALQTELLQLDVMSMTPIEAMNALYKLQQEAKKESGIA